MIKRISKVEQIKRRHLFINLSDLPTTGANFGVQFALLLDILLHLTGPDL